MILNLKINFNMNSFLNSQALLTLTLIVYINNLCRVQQIKSSIGYLKKGKKTIKRWPTKKYLSILT